jgi:hypothetical protein
MEIINATGTSARNRISELNQLYEAQHNKKRYIGKTCELEQHNHEANLFMYKLNNSEVEIIKPLSSESNKQKEEIQDWLDKTPEERHEHVVNLLKSAGLR